MGSKKTPLIQQLRKTGGTFYCFPSASEDVGLNLQTTTTGVALSHYALLNIPKLSIEKCLCESGHTAITGNQALAMSLQNYMMNFETKLTNEDSYNYQELNTTTEKVFWHWAKKIGIIDENNFSNEKAGNENIYVEIGRDSSSLIKDNTVVKCFGSIDAGNSLSTEFGMYNETYINIPTSYGAGPVYFETSSDENYVLGKQHMVLDTTHLEGRGDEYKYYTYTNGQDQPYFDYILDNKGFYKIDEKFDGITIVKDLSKIQTYARNQFNDQDILVSSYDDLNVDIDNHFNVDTEFNFNAILLYYSVYDQDDLIKTAYATNLFGIIFLDGTNEEKTSQALDVPDMFYIPTLTKRKSTPLTFGNSFSFRVNLKTMSVYDNTDAIIQDNTTMSSIASTDFSDVISNLNIAIDTLNSNTTVIANIQDRYAGILSYYDTLHDEIEDISTSLNAYLKGAKTSFLDTSILYVNEIRPQSLTEENIIKFNTRKSNTKNANGVYDYNNKSTLEIKDNYIQTENIYNKVLTNEENFIEVNDTSKADIHISKTYYDQQTETANEIIEKMFATMDDLLIMQKIDKLSESNQLYISKDSSIFNRERTAAEDCLSHLRDASGNINYVGMIPYIIGGLQTVYNNYEKGIVSYEQTYMPEEGDTSVNIGLLNIGNQQYEIFAPNNKYKSGANIYIDENKNITALGYNYDDSSMTLYNNMNIKATGDVSINGDLTFNITNPAIANIKNISDILIYIKNLEDKNNILEQKINELENINSLLNETAGDDTFF